MQCNSACPLCANSGHWHGSLQRLGSGYFDAQRNAARVTSMTSTVRSITSNEPSPSSGEKPKCRSIKSIGAALLRCAQSRTAPETAMIELKPISMPRVCSRPFNHALSPSGLNKFVASVTPILPPRFSGTSRAMQRIQIFGGSEGDFLATQIGALQPTHGRRTEGTLASACRQPDNKRRTVAYR